MITTAISTLLLLQSNSPAALPLKNVIDGINERNFSKIAAQYVGGKVIPAEAAALKQSPRTFRFSLKIDSVKLTGNSGTVMVQVKGEGFTQAETVNVVRNGGAWRIVSGKVPKGKVQIFESLGISVTKGGLFAQAVANSSATETLSNAKQTALAVMLYLGDHNDKFSFSPDDLSAIALPYVKHKEILLSKATGKPFTFNKRLTGTNAAAITEPAKTVLLYEGANERFTFTNGKTVVAFTDGHVRLLTPAETKSGLLRWKP